MSGDYPKNPAEWEEYEKKVAQEEENRKKDALAKILIPDAGKTTGDKQLTSDFLDRPGLKIQVYAPKSEGGIALPGEPCSWSDSWDAPRCNQPSDFLIVDPMCGKGAPLCRDHALQAAKERQAKAQTTIAALRAKRQAKNIRRMFQREGQEKG